MILSKFTSFVLLGFLFQLTFYVPNAYSDSASQNVQQTTPPVNQENAVRQSPEYWFEKLKSALTTSNFEASIVTLRGEKTESFQWLHGLVPQAENGQIEVERISTLIGNGISTIRIGDTVAFFEANKEPFSVRSQSIKNFLPPVFYRDVSELKDSYQFVAVSQSQIAGRAAQLIRVESKSKQTYNLWTWIDVLSGLPLRIAYVNERGDVVQQTLMTHLSLAAEPNQNILDLAKTQLPEPPSAEIASNQDTNNWRLGFIPQGFELLKSDRHHVSISREVSDYYLFSDGLVEFSIYVQRPIESFSSPLVLRDGGTSFVMVHADGFDVTVVGMIPAETAHQIATNVMRK